MNAIGTLLLLVVGFTAVAVATQECPVSKQGYQQACWPTKKRTTGGNPMCGFFVGLVTCLEELMEECKTSDFFLENQETMEAEFQGMKAGFAKSNDCPGMFDN